MTQMVECKGNWKVAEITILLHFTIVLTIITIYFILYRLITEKKRMIFTLVNSCWLKENASHFFHQLICTLLKDKPSISSLCPS